MAYPRSGCWRVVSRYNQRLICLWTSTYIIDSFDTEIDEDEDGHEHEVCVEKPFLARVVLHRVAGSAPIVIPKNGRSTFLPWMRIEKYQKKHGFKAIRVEVRELDARSHERFNKKWKELSYPECLELLHQLGKEES